MILALLERALWLGASCTVLRSGVEIKALRSKPDTHGTPVTPAPGSQRSTCTGGHAHTRAQTNTGINKFGRWFLLFLFLIFSNGQFYLLLLTLCLVLRHYWSSIRPSSPELTLVLYEYNANCKIRKGTEDVPGLW